MKRATNGHDADRFERRLSAMNPAQKALWYIESHLAGRADARRDRRDRRRLALPHGAGVCRCDRIFGHALRACPPPQQGGARAGGRRAGHSQPGAGCGLQLSRSIHPRVPRPFRRHARIGPRRNVPRPSQASGADHHGLQPRSTISRPRVSRPANRCSSPASASATTCESGAAIPGQWQRFHQSVDNIPGRIGKVAYGVCCNGDDAGNFDYIAGVEVSDFSDLPREFAQRADSRAEIRGVYPRASTSRPSAAPSTRSGITGCRRRG